MRSARTISPPPRRGAFTLPEIVVVIGIIVLFIALAIPAISAITGTRSIAAAENNLSAVLARAREEAIGVQDYRGVFFYLDTSTDTVVGALVMNVGQGPDSYNPPTNINSRRKAILLDTVPNRDFLVFPKGVRLRTIFDGAMVGAPDRYLGFNALTIGSNTLPGLYGGVILFDGMGRLSVQPYTFQMGSNTGLAYSGIASLLKIDPKTVLPATSFFPSPFSAAPNLPYPVSQIGVAFFDRRSFLSANAFKDGNQTLGGANVSSDDWVDANGTPLLVNRYTGTLIRGE